MAIRNFIARRGQPCKIYSDRGTNFVGADRELQRIHTAINHDEIMREFTTEETEWVFNPPMAPHMGGSWERITRTVKSNLMGVCVTKTLTDEVLRNLLTEIENVVYSRPLTHVPVDDDSDPALTPNHFLVGSSNGSKPLVIIDDSRYALKQNMCTSQILANMYWKRWIKDYLPEITRRSKFHSVKPIAIGDIVVIADPKLPRNCWPKGRVISTKASRDDQIRSATVQTASGVYERPVAKLAILDVQRVVHAGDVLGSYDDATELWRTVNALRGSRQQRTLVLKQVDGFTDNPQKAAEELAATSRYPSSFQKAKAEAERRSIELSPNTDDEYNNSCTDLIVEELSTFHYCLLFHINSILHFTYLKSA
ncbi:uncharacterized protein LOC134210345 [Armigeres subalbatus]|uniref:uncharacterized protein LOC134210345 n=1 Tax=Armigeres subalbatus TaxID=124917 RepID=UPI002ED37BD9